jgi:hypothetical protein
MVWLVILRFEGARSEEPRSGPNRQPDADGKCGFAVSLWVTDYRGRNSGNSSSSKPTVLLASHDNLASKSHHVASRNSHRYSATTTHPRLPAVRVRRCLLWMVMPRAPASRPERSSFSAASSLAFAGFNTNLR